MRLIDVGSGAPIVLVPGIQGRWEWTKPAIDLLSQRCRVITFSLADEPTSCARFDRSEGFRCYVQQITDAMNAAGIDRAAICGVSYGGLIAAAFAARHPERVFALVLVSALPPSWRPDWKARFFLSAPWLLFPLFALRSLRMYQEIVTATPGFVRSLITTRRHAMNVLRYRAHPGRMARRVRLIDGLHIDPGQVDVPTLVVTGDANLDRIVPVDLTHEYLRMWPRATKATIERTGHLGLITRSDEFARVVVPFVEDAASDRSERRRIG